MSDEEKMSYFNEPVSILDSLWSSGVVVGVVCGIDSKLG
jgi:hypothetical protein